MIFVAGKGGQVALSLEEAAKARGVRLTTFGRPDFDLTDKASVEAAISNASPRAIINAAAYTAVDQAENDEKLATKVNAEGASVLAATARQLDIPFIHLSTDYVFDGRKDAPYIETDAVGPTGAYGRSKLAGEQAVLAENPDTIVLRTAWVYSPFGRNFLKTMLSLAKKERLSVVADQYGNPTYAPDIAKAILDILDQIRGRVPATGQSGIFHMVGSGATTWHAFAEAIFAEGVKYGLPRPDVKAITTAEYPTPATRPANSRLDSGKLLHVYNISLPDWRESTAACVKRLWEMGELG